MHQGIVYSVAYSPDGKTLITGGSQITGGSDQPAALLWEVAELPDDLPRVERSTSEPV